MKCERCRAELGTMAARLNKVNASLHNLGLTYHTSLPVYQIDSILVDNGFVATDWTGVSTRLHQEVGDGKWLSIVCHRMESGNWEVVAYVN